MTGYAYYFLHNIDICITCAAEMANPDIGYGRQTREPTCFGYYWHRSAFATLATQTDNSQMRAMDRPNGDQTAQKSLVHLPSDTITHSLVRAGCMRGGKR